MGTTYRFQLKIKIRVTKSKKLKSEVAIKENVKNRCQKTGKFTENNNIYRLVSKNRNNVCKIINNVQKYWKQTTSSMPKIITQLSCKKRCEQTSEMYAAIQLKSAIRLSGK